MEIHLTTNERLGVLKNRLDNLLGEARETRDDGYSIAYDITDTRNNLAFIKKTFHGYLLEYTRLLEERNHYLRIVSQRIKTRYNGLMNQIKIPRMKAAA